MLVYPASFVMLCSTKWSRCSLTRIAASELTREDRQRRLTRSKIFESAPLAGIAAALLLACTNVASHDRSSAQKGGAGGGPAAGHAGIESGAGSSASGASGAVAGGGEAGADDAEAGDSASAGASAAGAGIGIAGQGGAPGAGAGGTAQAGDGSGGTAGAAGQPSKSHWVGTWTGAPQVTEAGNLPPTALSNTTLRQVVHVSLGGSQIRVRFSNEFGNNLLTINQTHVARCNANPVDGSIDVATDKALSFKGSPSVTVNPGQATWSDPLDFELAPLSNLSVTTAFGSVPSNVTGHPGSRTTSYEQTGSANISAADMTSALTTEHWYVLSGLDVMADQDAHGLVILGDSITDGRGSTTNGNNRWADVLAARFSVNAETSKVSVMNQGIGGNGLLGGLGPSATSRFDRDVLAQSGVSWVIVFEAVNDVGGGASTEALTAAYDEMIGKAHAQNLKIYGATITPFGSNGYYTVDHEAVRQGVNDYIRGANFDGFIDFDAAVRDTSNPPRLQGIFDSGDGLHLNPTGYQTLGTTVALDLFGN